MTRILASSLNEALQIAEDMKQSGSHDWFRGQIKDWHPLRASFARLNEEDQQVTIERVHKFASWMKTVPQLADTADNLDAVFAIAQHYGIPTQYLDFSTEPRVAAFFASHDPELRSAPGEMSVIICLSTQELARFWNDFFSKARPDLVEPECIEVDIPELWRIQAQRGAFLFLPYHNFEQTIYDFDRIHFPAEASDNIIPEQDVYPPQKSFLETLVDQYFMLESVAKGNKATQHFKMAKIIVEPLPGGIDTDCFAEEGLPLLKSWSEDSLAEWREPSPEVWRPLSQSPNVGIEFPRASQPAAMVSSLKDNLVEILDASENLREGPVVWKIHGVSSDKQCAYIVERLLLLWDGTRRWQYRNEDLAYGLSLTAVLAHQASLDSRILTDPRLAQEFVEECLGEVIEVEIGMSDGSYTRGYANASDLRGAVRADFHEHLNEQWRSEITRITHILQIANAPSRVLEFPDLATIFVRQIAPTQVAIRYDGVKALLHNVARAVSFGLP